jgi:hypothetical protein
MDHDAYVKFLVKHQGELNLPYPFAVKFSFISSPLLFGKGLLLFSEDPYRIVGAFGFVYGTGAGEYEDRHICQVETAFLLPEYRSSSLFAKALLFLVKEIKAGNPDVETLQFWAAADCGGLEGIISRMRHIPSSKRLPVNDLVCHQVPFRDVRLFAERFENRFRDAFE